MKSLMLVISLCLGSALVAACDQLGDASSVTPGDSKTLAEVLYEQPALPEASDDGPIAPVPIEEGVVKIGPDNTQVQFVGTHAAADPNPRVGGFTKFTGEIHAELETATVSSIEVEFEIASVWTEFAGLTRHLKTADFFDVEKFTTAKFASSRIEKIEGGRFTVTGDLTLHGTTKEIRFPAAVGISDNGLMMTSKFTLDRTDFGMDQMTSGVKEEVALEVIVGRKTEPKEEQSGPGGRNRKRGGRGAVPVPEPTTPAPQLVSLILPNML